MSSETIVVNNNASSLKIENIENLVFKGGSVKGIAYVGAIEALKRVLEDYENKISRVCGTSAGAITALFLAIGCNTEDLIRLLVNTNLEEFLDDSDSWSKKKNLTKSHNKSQLITEGASAYWDLNGRLGLFKTVKVRDWLKSVILDKTGDGYITFRELHKLRESDPKFKDLYVTGFNLTKTQSLVFSHSSTPDAVILDSVAISMSIPFLFEPHSFKIKNPVEGHAGSSLELVTPEEYTLDKFVDGGIVNNYPIDVFDEIPGTGENTLGFYLATAEEINWLTQGKPIKPCKTCKLGGYATAVLETLLSYHQVTQHKNSGDQRRTIYIDIGNIGTLDFNLDRKAKSQLIESGWTAVYKAFEGKFPIVRCPIKLPEEPKIKSLGWWDYFASFIPIGTILRRRQQQITN